MHRTKFVELDGPAVRIQAAVAELEDAGQIKSKGGRRPPRFDGYCARMCEAYTFLAKDPRTEELATPGAAPTYVKPEDEESHYWMAVGDGVMDLNFDVAERPERGYADYSDGKPARNQGMHPWKDDARYPNNGDARKIMDAVWRQLEAGA